MLNQVTSRDVMTKDYLASYTFAGSSRTEELDMSAIWDGVFFIGETKELPMRPWFRQSLLRLLEIDASSVCPYSEPMTGASLFEGFQEEIPFEEELEYDIVVRMPPIRRRRISVKVRSVQRATPRFVEPEGFWPWR